MLEVVTKSFKALFLTAEFVFAIKHEGTSLTSQPFGQLRSTIIREYKNIVVSAISRASKFLKIVAVR